METFQYWLNPNRPDRVYRTNGQLSFQRFADSDKWTYHEANQPALPNEHRYEVSEAELQREKVC
jgi:hypothetical protein